MFARVWVSYVLEVLINFPKPSLRWLTNTAFCDPSYLFLHCSITWVWANEVHQSDVFWSCSLLWWELKARPSSPCETCYDLYWRPLDTLLWHRHHSGFPPDNESTPTSTSTWELNLFLIRLGGHCNQRFIVRYVFWDIYNPVCNKLLLVLFLNRHGNIQDRFESLFSLTFASLLVASMVFCTKWHYMRSCRISSRCRRLYSDRPLAPFFGTWRTTVIPPVKRIRTELELDLE